MASATTVPVEIEPEAAARVGELGLRRELDAMIDQARRTIPDLQAIDVALSPNPDEPMPAIVIYGWRDVDGSTWDIEATADWYRWAVKTYPPEVFQWFSLVTYPLEYRGR